MNRIATTPPEAPQGLDGPGWESLMRLAADLGDGDAARGLDSVVGIVRNVRANAALEASTPWVRTLAASQVSDMTDEEILFAFRLDGASLPRLREIRAAFQGGSNTLLDPALDPGEVVEAEWLLRMMGLRSNLTRLAERHLRCPARPGRA